MAVSFKADHSRTSEYRFWPEDIVVKGELNGRHNLPEIADLIADIEANGQGVPVTIRNDGGRPVLVKGFSRWRAIVDINKRHPKEKRQVRCVYTQLSEHEAFLENIAENRFRNATTELDDAHNIKRLMKVYAMTEEQIVPVYFPAAQGENEKKDALKWIRKTLKLADLTKEAELAVRSGRLKGSAALAISKLSAELQREVVKGEGKINSSAIRHAQGKNGDRAPSLSLKQQIQRVIESGKFPGIGGKQVEASDDLVEFLGRLVGRK